MTSFGRLYFWIPSTPELLYVTECYNLEGVLQRISGGFELQTESVDPLNLQHNPLYDTDLSLWFWQVPSGWSQDEKELEYFQEIALG